MIPKHYSTFLIVALFFSINVFGQQNCGYVKGVILDKFDDQPLEFATIYIEELGISTYSNEQGKYIFTPVCDGNYTIKIIHLGCEDLEQKLFLKANSIQNFYLNHSENALREVDIIEKKIAERPTQSINTIEGIELNALQGKPLGELLKAIPGINSIQTGNSISKPVIHGLHSNRVLILNNGIRQEGQQWGSEHAPEIDPFLANKISVIKGASAVRYGSDAIAGVIILEPDAISDSTHLQTQINMQGNSNGRQGIISTQVEQSIPKIQNLKFRIQGTAKRSGNVRSPNYYQKNTGYKELNFSGALQWIGPKLESEIFYSQFNTQIGIFTGSHIGNLSDLQQAFASTKPLIDADFSYEIDRPYQNVRHELFKVKNIYKINSKQKVSLVLGRQFNLRSEYDKDKPLKDSLAKLNRPELQYNITTYTIDLMNEHVWNQRFHGSFGYGFIQQSNTYNGRLFIPFYRNYTNGMFWIERYEFNKIELEAGLRYDKKFLEVFQYQNNILLNPEYNFQKSSANIGLIYKFNLHSKLNVNYGNSWRAPAVNELFSNGLHHGAAAIETGNPNLKVENSKTFIATYEYHNHSNLDFGITSYVNYFDNYIYLKPSLRPVLTIRGAFPSFEYAQSNVLIRGVDLNFEYLFLGRLKFQNKSSLLRAFNYSINDYLINMPADRTENALNFQFKDFGKVMSPNVKLSVLSVAKQNRVPLNSDYVNPPEAYHLLNIEASMKLNYQKIPLNLGVNINNVLNTKYRDYLDRFRYYTDAIGINVGFFVKANF